MIYLGKRLSFSLLVFVVFLSILEAIVRWRFKPRVINGQPVPVRVVQRINFDLLSIQ